MYDKKKGKSLDELESEGERENIRYISLLFIANPPPQKELNRSTNMGEGIKSINHLVCI